MPNDRNRSCVPRAYRNTVATPEPESRAMNTPTMAHSLQEPQEPLHVQHLSVLPIAAVRQLRVLLPLSTAPWLSPLSTAHLMVREPCPEWSSHHRTVAALELAASLQLPSCPSSVVDACPGWILPHPSAVALQRPPRLPRCQEQAAACCHSDVASSVRQPHHRGSRHLDETPGRALLPGCGWPPRTRN